MAKNLFESCADIWEKARQSVRQTPSQITLPQDHVTGYPTWGTPFQPDEHYFQVRLNQMYLTYDRQWFSEYDPMVFVVSEFSYDKRQTVVPYLVGPMILQQYSNQVPDGMIFSDTRVAGLHPYRGGRLSLSVILCRVKRKDYVRQLLQLVENAASALDFSTALSSYIKIASLVVDGVDALLGGGDSQPLIGYRKEFDPEAGEGLAPHFFTLIDLPPERIHLDELWVKENQLWQGKSLEQARPFREANFVLYSLTQAAERSDLSILPFYPLWERVQQEATVAKKGNWLSAKANMLSLYQSMLLSPDLTPFQADALADRYTRRMNALHERVVSGSPLGEDERALEQRTSMLDEIRSKSVSILDL